MYKHILIPTDGSDLSNKAVKYGIALAKAMGAKVTAITVTVPFHVFAIDPETFSPASSCVSARLRSPQSISGGSSMPRPPPAA